MKWIFSNDRYQMSWFREDFEYAQIRCSEELEYTVKNQQEGDCLYTEILFTNRTQKPYFTNAGSIGIAFPLVDKYEDSLTCLAQRCHGHIFCGGNASYVMALRMGGEAPHLGMVLTEGSLADYSIERDIARMSNDRGCFWLHPSPLEFEAGESKRICWTVFRHEGREDFQKKLKQYSRFVEVTAEHYVVFQGEKNRITVVPAFTAQNVRIDGAVIKKQGEQYVFEYTADELGEKVFEIEVDGIKTWCRVFVHAVVDDLAEKRCQFIVEKQQYHGTVKRLQDAYLAYDNEEKVYVYTSENDFNGGRERIGMGVLIARYLQQHCDLDKKLEHSLYAYLDYVMRELVDIETGIVYNDIGRDGSFKRLYNAPWAAEFFTELYRWNRKREYLTYACRIVNAYYQEGGTDFYPIELPVKLLYDALMEAEMQEEADALKRLFCKHADRLMQTGIYYPGSEVNYEQSIVAPAADILLQVYQITEDEKYLDAGIVQMKILEMFQGIQPDYHLYETAIRHWDGYWFGKRRMYGDTFPHYWSALTGNVFERYGRICENPEYLKKAEDARRSVLTMIFADGSASCACVFPYSVNGVRTAFYDPYANDQDWGLYFYLRALDK